MESRCLLYAGVVAVLAGILPAGLRAGESPLRRDRRARDIFLAGQGEPGGATPAPTSLGVKFWVALRQPDGAFRDVQATQAFRSGDEIKFRFQSNLRAYAYVFNEGTTGRCALLFPGPGSAEANLIDPYRTHTIPPGDPCFKFDMNPGTEKLYLVLSRTPVADLTPILRNHVPAPPAATPGVTPPRPTSQCSAEENAVLSQLFERGLQRASRDIIYHPETTATGAQATYAVDTAPAGDAPMVLRLDLEHR